MVDTKEEAYSLAKDIKMSMVTKPALNMLEVFLPEYVTKEFNEYIDGVRGSAKSLAVACTVMPRAAARSLAKKAPSSDASTRSRRAGQMTSSASAQR